MPINYDQIIADAIAKRDSEKDKLKYQDIGSDLAYGIAGADRPKDQTIDRQSQTLDQGVVDAISRGKLAQEGDLKREMEAGRLEDRSIQRDQAKAMREQTRTDRQAMHQDKLSHQAELMADKRKHEATLSDPQLKELTDLDTSIGTGDDLLSRLKPEYVGQIDGRLPDMVSSADNVAFRSSLGRMVDQYRKLITGAGAGNKELQMLAGRLPQLTDTHANFTAKAKDLVNATKRARESHLKNLSARGKDTSAFVSSDTGSRAGASVSKKVRPEDIDHMSEAQLKAYLGHK